MAVEHVVAAVLASAVVVVIVAVAPVSGWRRYSRLLRDLRTDDRARLAFYRDAILRQWALVAVVVLAGVLAGRAPRAIGLPDYGPGPADGGLIAVILASAAAAAGPVLIVTRRRGPPLDESVARQLAPLIGLAPTSRSERRIF